MPSPIRFPFYSGLKAATSFGIRRDAGAAIDLTNNRVFPYEKIYVGRQARPTRYIGSKTDSQVYLGKEKLF